MATKATYGNTRIRFVTAWVEGARSVTLWEVVVEVEGRTVFGPAPWKACSEFKRGLPR